jgi:hypothetical protein
MLSIWYRPCRGGGTLCSQPPSGRVADFYSHLLAQSRKGSLDSYRLRSMLGIEHAADHPLVDPKVACQLGEMVNTLLKQEIQIVESVK